MNFKIPIIGAVVSFVLFFLINLIRGNGFPVSAMRSLLSGGVIFGLFTGMIFVFKNVLGVDLSQQSQDLESNDTDDDLGQKLDVTVGDDDSSQLSDSGEYNPDETFSESNEGTDDQIGGVGDSAEKEPAFYDAGFSDVGTSSGDLSADTLREKLGYDASTEDLSKAIRTVINRDD